MKQLLSMVATLLVAVSLLWSSPHPAGAAAQDEVRVRQDMETTLDLWRSGRFEEVYQRVMESGGHTKEYFVSHLAVAPRKPACCWEKIQDVRVTIKREGKATLKAKFGLDSGTGTEFMTRGVTLEQEDGVWKVKMSDLLALAGTSGKVKGSRKSK